MDKDITAQVRAFYNRYPYPPEPLLDMPPLGWNWRWSWRTIHALYYGYLPVEEKIQILDAGCGTGFGSQYLGYQNPQAQVWGVDLSEAALAVAQERCTRAEVTNVRFEQGSILTLPDTKFEFINCVGVLHHLVDPLAGLQALGERLAPGGLMHLFVYSEVGRWEIRLMQEALRLLHVKDVATGRSVLRALPKDNRLCQFEVARWAEENREDSSFADMYLQVQETQYNVLTLLQLIEQAGLHLVAFSNPEFWSTERLLGADAELVKQANDLPELERYRLIELLDATPNHYELFVAKAPISPWQPTDSELLNCIVHRSPYLGRWPSQLIFNYCYQEITLTPEAYRFLEQVDGTQTVGQLTLDLPLVRSLADQILIMLEPQARVMIH